MKTGRSLGLLEYVDSVRALKQSHLFHYRTVVRGNRGIDASENLSALLHRLNLKPADQMTGLHSFRDTIAMALEEKGVEEKSVAQILGHVHNTVTRRHYSVGYQLTVLQPLLESAGLPTNLPPFQVLSVK